MSRKGRARRDRDRQGTALAPAPRQWRRRGLAVGVLVALAGSVLLARWAWGKRHVELPPPAATVADTGPTFADFVGTATCATCHAAEHAEWHGSTHGQAGGAPGAVRIIAPFDGVALHFKDALVIPRVNPEGEHVFVVKEHGRPVRTFRVDAIVGGGHLAGGGTQTFFSGFPDGTLRFLPFDYAKDQGIWFCNTNGRDNRGGVPITSAVALAECGDWPPVRVLGKSAGLPNCQQCHGSQIEVEFDAAARRYRTRFLALSVNCESCHGPGRRHVELARAGVLDTSAALGLVALDTLTKDQSVRVCLRCHALKSQLKPGYLPGRGLEAYYALKFPSLTPLYFPDGRTRTFAYQANHLASDCYVNGSMTCVDCHDPHTQRYRDIAGVPLPGRFDDGQCVDCHPSRTGTGARHTHHQPGSPGSRCTSCHMPYRQEAAVGQVVRYTRSDHNIPIPRPAFDARLGVENACQQCHTDRSSAELAATTESWYGALKPPPALVVGMVDAHDVGRVAAARLLLARDPRHPVAAYAALSQFQSEHLRPDMPRLEREVVKELKRLAASDDRDIQALALASLHIARGQEPGVRAFLARALTDAGPDAEPLRQRWGETLVFRADQFLSARDAPAAIATLRKAAEIQPRDPTPPWKLGIAFAHSRDLGEAGRQFRTSLALDPDQPLVLSDLALALAQQGDVRGALDAAGRAVLLNPWSGSAYLSLGYAHLREGRPALAVEAFERAVTVEPGLADAHFALARAYRMLGDTDHEAAALEHGLEFEPGNAGARRALTALRAPR